MHRFPVNPQTDMGDWHDVPARLRWAFAAILVPAVILGLGLAFGLVSWTWAALALGAGGPLFYLVFDKRRSWWPPERALAVDPVVVGARRNVIGCLAIGAVTLVLLALGVVRL